MKPPPVRVCANQPFDLYAGRPIRDARDPRIPAGAPKPYIDPFRHAHYRRDALTRFAALWRHRLAGKRRRLWLKALYELGGLRVACHCAQAPADWSGPYCHVDVLIELYREFVLGFSSGQREQRTSRECARVALPAARESPPETPTACAGHVGIETEPRRRPFLSPWEGIA